MSMDAQDLKAVVDYVRKHSGCTESEIRDSFPGIKDIDSLLEEASAGAVKWEDGYILKEKEGKYFIGPQTGLDL